VLWGAFVGWWMPDSPMRAHCFTENDKKLMVERVRRNRTGLQNRKFRKDQLLEVFRDPQGKQFSKFRVAPRDMLTAAVYAIALIQLLLTITLLLSHSASLLGKRSFSRWFQVLFS
jgi:hypothetical protein